MAMFLVHKALCNRRTMGAMRLAVAAVILCSCGSDHFGTYFIADGRAARIDFDHAEFFFGSQTDGAYASPLGASSGRVFRRRFVSSDSAVGASSDATATYYVPVASTTEVGNYVMAVARDAADVIVGVGDASDFPLASGDEVIKVELPLEPPGNNVQVWGVDATCAAWTRPGSSNVAVVQPDDRDCDGAAADDDCNDLSYCAPGDASCSTDPSLCLTPCAIGCRSSTTCAPSVCLPAAVCTLPDGCRAASTVAERIACLASHVSHLHVLVSLMDNGRPCADSFTVSLPSGTQCTRPAIEYSEPTADGYSFKIQDDGASCTFAIKAPSNPGAFNGDHHVLVSIAAASGIGPRQTFLVGVKAVQGQAGAACTTPLSTDGQLEINSCQ